MSTNLGFAGRLLTNAAGKVLSFGGTVTAPVVLPTPDAPLITNENDEAQTLTFSVPVGLSFDQVRYEVAGAGPYTPTGLTIQLSPTTSFLVGSIVLYVAGVDGVRTESQRVANRTVLAAYVPPTNVNPAAPALAVDDSANTLTVTSAYALSELEQRITDTGAAAPLPSLQQQVGDVDRPEGYYQVRVTGASGRNPSNWARSAKFTKTAVGGPPAGFTGPIASGYVAAGDSRIVTNLDDAHAAWAYTGPWMIENQPGFYWLATIHYADSYVTAKVTYYGGGFKIWGHTAAFGDADIWIDGSYHSTVSYYSNDPKIAAVLATIVLPEGLHTVEFRYKDTLNRPRLVHDGIQLTSKA